MLPFIMCKLLWFGKGRIKIVTFSKVVFCYIFFGKLSLFRYSKVIKKKIITNILYFEIKNILKKTKQQQNSDRLSVDSVLVMVTLFSLSACICVFVSLDNSSLDDSAFSTDSNNEQASESSSAPESRADRPRPRPRPSKGESPPSTSSRSRSQNVPSSLHRSHIKQGSHISIALISIGEVISQHHVSENASIIIIINMETE